MVDKFSNNPFLTDDNNNPFNHSRRQPHVTLTKDVTNKPSDKIEQQPENSNTENNNLNIEEKISHLNENDSHTANVNEHDSKWNAIMNNDPTIDDEVTASKIYRKNKNKKKASTFISVIIIVALLAIIFGSIYYMFNSMKWKTMAPGKPIKVEKIVKNKNAVAQSVNPTDKVAFVSASLDSKVSFDGNNKHIKIDSENFTVSAEFPFMQNLNQKAECNLVTKTGTCYVGEAKIADDKSMDVFAFRDASDSSLLLTHNKIKKLDINGAAVAYTTKTVYNGSVKTVLIIVNKDQTGIVLAGEEPIINEVLAQKDSIKVDFSSKTK